MGLEGAGQLLFGAGGIYAAFLYYGYLQEEVLNFTSTSGEKFKYSWFLQVLEAFANVILGLVCGLVFEGMPRAAVPQVPYFISGAVQVSAKYCTTASMVAGVSFPVATLAKSSKMVPVMIGQLVLGKATYTFREYAHVAAIVGGTALVSMAGKSKPGAGSSATGLAFLVAALACDGVVGGTQKRLKQALSEKGMKEKNFEMQFFTNLYMTVTAIFFSFFLGEFRPGYEFLIANPSIFKNIIQFALCSAVGQAFIFYMISSFDPLACTTVTTTRKVFSVLYSIFAKGHQLNTQGWAGVSLACAGILAELQEKFSRTQDTKHGKKEKENTNGNGADKDAKKKQK